MVIFLLIRKKYLQRLRSDLSEIQENEMKIICIGLNYRKHALELGRPLPVEPVVFLKPDSSILKNNKPFFLPDFSSMIHYEVEVVIKISKLAKGISARFA